MFKNRRYLKPRIAQAAEEFYHTLDEATLLAEALVLQHTGTNLDRFKNFDFKKASIDSLNDILSTLKSLVKNKLHFLDDNIDDEREECLRIISSNSDFAQIVTKSLQLNLISDNNDISLYLAPYCDYWELLTAGVRALILNQVIRSINQEIQRTQLVEKISKKF
ncbi:MAG: hypothetical protein ACFFDW_10705 [Candidatus Thorarchaeota archaeon]